MVKSPVREAGSYGFESHLKHVAYGIDVMAAYTFPTRIVRVRILHTVFWAQVGLGVVLKSHTGLQCLTVRIRLGPSTALVVEQADTAHSKRAD